MLQNIQITYLYKYLISGIPNILPEGVEYPTVIPDSKHAIGRGDPVGISLLRVAEESVRDPDLPHHVAVETQNLHRAVEFQPPVVPGLSKKDVDGVFLMEDRTQFYQDVVFNF